MSYKIAGIDVHKKVLMVVVLDAHAPADEPERRRFATMPSDLRRFATWLREREVQEAVMESTAQYWRFPCWMGTLDRVKLQLAITDHGSNHVREFMDQFTVERCRQRRLFVIRILEKLFFIFSVVLRQKPHS